MKTLFFTLEYPPFHGGISTMYAEIVAHWPNDGRSAIEVIDNSGGKLVAGHIPVWKWLKSFPYVLNAIKKRRPDHVIIGHILPLGTVVYMACRLTRTPYSIILHGMDLASALKNPRKKLLARIILSGATVAVCSNGFVRRLLDDFSGGRVPSITVNPGIADHEMPSPDEIRSFRTERSLDGKIIGLTICRLVKRKGIDKMIKALPLILEHIPNFEYVIGGAGPDEDYLKACVNSLDPAVLQRVRFLGPVKEDEKWMWLSACDMFAMPSRLIGGNDIEGFGIVYLEAAIAGKPVIAGDSGGIRDAVLDGRTGLVVDGDRTEAVAEAVVQLCLDPDLRSRLGSRGRERALREFNWSVQSRKIFDAASG
jgi:phosphatidylinositol alpha-1,6-mannosyltransferase